MLLANETVYIHSEQNASVSDDIICGLYTRILQSDWSRQILAARTNPGIGLTPDLPLTQRSGHAQLASARATELVLEHVANSVSIFLLVFIAKCLFRAVCLPSAAVKIRLLT